MSISVDKLVAEIRLRKIEHDHKSLGARLDNRRLHDLGAVGGSKKKTKKRRDALAAEAPPDSVVVAAAPPAPPAANSAANSATNATDATGGKSTTGTTEPTSSSSGGGATTAAPSPSKRTDLKLNNYDNETLLWKTKSANPHYSLKRRFEKPELQKHLDSFVTDQRRDFYVKSKAAIVDMGKKLREQMSTTQSDMNSRGIFHPSANAERIRSQYLTKFYRKIQSSAIEDPVIESIVGEEDRKRREIEEEERRTNELLMKYSGNNPGKSTDNAGGDTKEEEKKGEEEKDKDKKKGARRETAMKLETSGKKKDNKKEEKDGTGTAANTPKASAKDKEARDRERNRDRDRDGASVDGISVTSAKEQPNAESLERMKVKRIKIGTTDARELLELESDRLNECSILAVKKPKDSSNLMLEATADWMTASLHDSQIDLASGGYAFSLPSWKTKKALNEPAAGEEPIGTIPKFTGLVNFKDFEAILTSIDATAKGKGNNEEDEDYAVDEHGFRLASPKRERGGSLDETKRFDADMKEIEDHEKGRIGDKDDPLASPPGKSNIVKQLSEADPFFKAFLKVSQSRPAAKSMTKQVEKLTTALQKRIKKLSPLGLTAVTTGLKSSRPAFPNVFEITLEEHDEIMKAAMELDEEEVQQKNTEAVAKAAAAAMGGSKSTDLNDEDEDEASETTAPIMGKQASMKTRKSRSPSRSSHSVGDGTNADETDNDFFYQNKLNEVWDTLRTTAVNRLTFMGKYTLEENAKLFPTAIDRWGEIAVMVSMRLECLKAFKMMKEEQIIFPFRSDKLFSIIESARESRYLSNPSPAGDPSMEIAHFGSSPIIALSHAARHKLIDIVLKEFSTYEGNEITGLDQGKTCLISIIQKVDVVLKAATDSIARDLDDTVMFGGSSVSEWMRSTSKKLQEKENSGGESKGGGEEEKKA